MADIEPATDDCHCGQDGFFTCQEWRVKAQTAEAEVARLREALDEFGNHLAWCKSRMGPRYPCGCGWEAAFKAHLEGHTKGQT